MKELLPYQSSHSIAKGKKSSRKGGERMKSIDSMERSSNARPSNTQEQESEIPNVPSIQTYRSSSKANENATSLFITPQITETTNGFIEVKRGKNRKHSRKNKQHHSFGSQTAPSNVSDKSKRDFEDVEDSRAVNVDGIHNSRLHTLDMNRLDVSFRHKESTADRNGISSTRNKNDTAQDSYTTSNSKLPTPSCNKSNAFKAITSYHSGNSTDCDRVDLAVGSIQERNTNKSSETEYPSVFDIHSNDDGDAKMLFQNDANSCFYHHYYTKDNDQQGLLPTPTYVEQEGGYPTPEQLAMMTQQPNYWCMELPFMMNNEYLPCYQEYYGAYFAPDCNIGTTSPTTTTTTAIEPAHRIVGYEQVNVGGCIYFHPVFE